MRQNMTRENIAARWLPLAVFVAVALFMLRPASYRLTTHVLARPFEDAFESIWYLHWYQQAIFHLRHSPFFQPDIFYPEGWELGFAVMPPFYPLLLAPLTYLLGAVTVYNLSLLFTAVFAAYGTFLVCRAAGSNIGGGLLAGIAFAFYPQRQIYYYGHLNLAIASMWMPWMVYGLIRAKEAVTPRQQLKWLSFVGLCYGLGIAGAWQFLFLGLGLLLTFGLVYFWPVVRRNWRGWWWPVGGMVLCTAVIALPLLINAIAVQQRTGADPVFSFAQTDYTGVHLEWIVAPHPNNPFIWEKLINPHFPPWRGVESVVSFGMVVVALALYGMVKQRPWSPLYRALFVMILIGLLLMPGLTLHIWGEPVTLQPGNTSWLQRFAPELIIDQETMRLPMPAYIFYKLAPPFRAFHHFSRWGLLVSLGLAVFTAVGFTHLVRHRRRLAQVGFVVALVFFMLLEFNFRKTITTTEQMQRGVDTWLAAQPEQSVIIEYPLTYTMKPHSLYYTIAHGQKIVHGSSLPTTHLAAIRPVLEQWPDGAALELLDDLGVRYILVYGNEFVAAEYLPTWQAVPGMRFIGAFAGPTAGSYNEVYVFELESQK